LRCLLLDWMGRLDGFQRYYSDPTNNYDEGDGDITEIQNRQKWKDIDFWVGDTVIEFGTIGMAGSEYKRHEYLYFGSRISSTGDDIVVKLSLVSESGDGEDTSSSFSLDKTTVVLKPGSCESVRITFTATDDSWTEGRSNTILSVEPEDRLDLQKLVFLHTPSKLPPILQDFQQVSKNGSQDGNDRKR
jgi:hypothetical protein